MSSWRWRIVKIDDNLLLSKYNDICNFAQYSQDHQIHAYKRLFNTKKYIWPEITFSVTYY